MSFDQIILWIMAIGLLVGGADKILGNHFGLGEKFDEGFKAMGALALGMVGIICLIPIIQKVIENTIRPFFLRIHIDPAMIGSILANDMGGYPLAMQLAVDERVGLLAGTIVSSMLGAVLVFHIPVGLGLIDKEKHPYFAKGLLIGLVTMPIGSIAGGVAAGFPVRMVLINMLPIVLVALLMAAGLKWIPDTMIKGSLLFGKLITTVVYVGLMCIGFQYITNVVIIPGMVPVEEGMAIVAGIAIVLAGAYPVLELLMRALGKPLLIMGNRLGLDTVSTAGLIFALANSIPVFTMIKKMEPKGVVVNTAWAVTVGAAFGDHLGFTASVYPKMIGPMIIGKITAGVLAVILAMLLCRERASECKKVSGSTPDTKTKNRRKKHAIWNQHVG